MTAFPQMFAAPALAPGLRFRPGHRPVYAAGNWACCTFLRTSVLLLMSLASIAGTAFSQAIPAAVASPISTGFRLPSVQGSLNYSFGIHGSESSGYYSSNGNYYSGGYSGNLAFITANQVHPFSMIASAGGSWGTYPQSSTPYYSVAFSQVLNTRTWHFILSDAPSYLPETPTTGLSGIPGTGDLGIAPIQVGTSGQGVLTTYATRVSNATTLSVSRSLTGKTSFQTLGTYSTLFFVGNSNGGVNTDTLSISGGLSHRITGRSSLSASYAYSESFYGPGQSGFISQTTSASFSHQFSPRLTFGLSAGPQWTTYTNTSPAAPTTLSIYANASIGYTAGLTHYSLSYFSGTNAGSGVSQGARSNGATISASRPIARVWSGAISGAYTQTTSLAAAPTSFAAKTIVGSAQISRALARNISIFASYTLEDQPSSGTLAGTNAFAGVYRTAAFGLTYSPRSIRVGHQ